MPFVSVTPVHSSSLSRRYFRGSSVLQRYLPRPFFSLSLCLNFSQIFLHSGRFPYHLILCQTLEISGQLWKGGLGINGRASRNLTVSFPCQLRRLTCPILTMKLYGVLVLMATVLTGRTRHESFYITLSLTFVLQSTAAFKYNLLKM